MHPHELLAFVHHVDKAAKAPGFGFKQGVESAQAMALQWTYNQPIISQGAFHA